MGYLLQHMLRDSASRQPDAPAVLYRDETLTYGELERHSDALAHALRRHGVRRGDRVAIYMEKSPGSLLAIHAILKAGAAYVPLDPQAPVERLAFIVGNCGVRCIVASIAKAPAIAGMRQHGARPEVVVFVDGEAPQPDGAQAVTREAWLAHEGDGALACRSIETDLAYILYTSGSTGNPKGVMISHRNALGFVEWAAGHFAVTAADRLSSHAPLHFDLSIFDIFVAMHAGASVALVPDGTSTFPVRLAEWMQRSAITIWYSVPSILTLLLLKGRLDRANLERLRLVIFAGEVFPTRYLREIMAVLPHAAFVNLYGPTETNVITWYQVPPLPPEQTAPIPIGWTCANTDLFLVDDDGRLVTSAGAEGELCARGVTVAQGYWGDPARTSRTFVQNPFEEHFADRVYRTGDIVTLGEDGAWRLVGRRDRMIKSRGYRIELDEIEVVLHANEAVKEAAVIGVPDELIGTRIRAFLAPVEGATLEAGPLRDWCLRKLPRYMVPESFEVMDALPKTSTGKVDRTRLATEHGHVPGPAS
jgi:amino acid adenylation domain-containing protein